MLLNEQKKRIITYAKELAKRGEKYVLIVSYKLEYTTDPEIIDSILPESNFLENLLMEKLQCTHRGNFFTSYENAHKTAQMIETIWPDFDTDIFEL